MFSTLTLLYLASPAESTREEWEAHALKDEIDLFYNQPNLLTVGHDQTGVEVTAAERRALVSAAAASFTTTEKTLPALFGETKRLVIDSALLCLHVFLLQQNVTLFLLFTHNVFHCCQGTFLSVLKPWLCSVRRRQQQTLASPPLQNSPFWQRTCFSAQISLPKILHSETEGQGSANPHFWPGLRFHSDAIFLLHFHEYHTRTSQFRISSEIAANRPASLFTFKTSSQLTFTSNYHLLHCGWKESALNAGKRKNTRTETNFCTSDCWVKMEINGYFIKSCFLVKKLW